MSDELLRDPTHNGHLLVGALKRHKNRPVLFLGDTTLTGGQLAERTSQYIQAFEALNAGTGVTVGLLALNRPEVLMILGASQTQGYRRTALHPLGSLDDHAYVLSDAGATALIIDPNPMFVERALGLLDKVDSLEQILTIGPVPEQLKGVAVDLNAEAAKYSPQPITVADLPPNHVGGLTYTGGTTGKPKGVIGTTGNIATMTQIQLAEWEWPEHPRFLMCTPLSHADAAFFTRTPRPATCRRWKRCITAITYLAKADHDEKRLTSCGRPTLFARVALLGDDGQPVPQGEPGEICVSGPLLAGGYWQLPEATADTFKDGWLHTGDMAREDEDGFYFIVDRVKDMIVTGGFNVFPREVEDVIAEHPSVAQVCVVGTPDDKWGEAVTAVGPGWASRTRRPCARSSGKAPAGPSADRGTRTRLDAVSATARCRPDDRSGR